MQSVKKEAVSIKPSEVQAAVFVWECKRLIQICWFSAAVKCSVGQNKTAACPLNKHSARFRPDRIIQCMLGNCLH